MTLSESMGNDMKSQHSVLSHGNQTMERARGKTQGQVPVEGGNRFRETVPSIFPSLFFKIIKVGHIILSCLESGLTRSRRLKIH